jgi:hypothetical protein
VHIVHTIPVDETNDLPADLGDEHVMQLRLGEHIAPKLRRRASKVIRVALA